MRVGVGGRGTRSRANLKTLNREDALWLRASPLLHHDQLLSKMASLNWVHLSTSSAPLPLPEEKFLLTIPSVALTLFPCPPGAPTKPTAPSSARHATGNVFVSNQRVVFVASTATAGGSLAGGNASVVGQATAAYGVQTLSMPFQHFLDGRYVQPWFAATYYEALLLPVEGGGLEVR